jgi:hypothetical protein
MVATIILPASVQSGDSISQSFDGHSGGSFPITEGGTTTHRADGTWVDTSTNTASSMQADCARGGQNSSGIDVLTPGDHVITISDATGNVLATGSYTVTDTAPTPTAAINRGKVIFSTDVPSSDNGCRPSHQVTSVSDTTSVYATYVFDSKPGGETITLEVTRDGQPYIPATDLPTADANGLDCFADTSDLSKLDNWGAGTYHVSLTSSGAVVAQGDLTVTATP